MKKRVTDRSELIRVYTTVCVRVIAIILGILLAAWLVYKLSALILLLIISIFFSYLLAPLVGLFENAVYFRGKELKLSKPTAICVVYILVGGILFVVLEILIPKLWDQVTDLAQNLPTYIASASNNINSTIKNANMWVKHANLSRSVQDYLLKESTAIAEALFPWLQSHVVGLLAYLQYLPWLILVPVISFFLLKDASHVGDAIIDAMPNDKLKKRVRWMLLDMSKTIAAYIRAQITACIVIGLLVSVGLWIIGAPYPVVLGVMSGFMEFVPLAGPLIAAVIIVSLSAIYSIKTAFIAALFLIILRLAQDYVIYPRIIGEGIKMPPFIVILAILAGAEIAGLIGIFFSIPVVGLIIVFIHHYRAYRGLEKIKAERTEIESSKVDFETSSIKISNDSIELETQSVEIESQKEIST
ncbi:MAG: AI-2E family transporter [Acidobacteriota bacterium]